MEYKAMRTHNFTQEDRQYPMGTRICEICGKEGIIEYMYAMGASWHVTGSFSVASFNCQTEQSAQHWGCCPEHAMEALMICLEHDEHMSVNVMLAKHKDATDNGLPRFAPEHARFIKSLGSEFYIFGQAKKES
jgi:hypothetical protein